MPPVLGSEVGVAEADEVAGTLVELLPVVLVGVELDATDEVVDGVGLEVEVVVGVLVGSKLEARPAAAEMTPPKLIEL